MRTALRRRRARPAPGRSRRPDQPRGHHSPARHGGERHRRGQPGGCAPRAVYPATLALIRLVIARDELRARLRAATGSRIPLVSESTAMAARYLEAERDLGRVAAGTDISVLAPTLIGAAVLAAAQ